MFRAFLGRFGVNGGYIVQHVPYLAASEITTSMLRLLLSMTLARALGQEQFGRYGFVLSWITVFSVLTLPGLDMAVNAATARGFDGTLREAVGAKTRWSIVGSGGLVLIAVYFWWIGERDVALGIFLGGVFLHGFYLSIYDNYLQGKQRFQQVFWVRLITNGLTVGVTAAVALYYRSAVTATAAYFGSSAVLHWYLTYKYVKNAGEASTELGAVDFGRSLTWVSVIGVAASNLDRFIIQGTLGYQELAVYVVVMGLPSQMRRAYGVLFAVVFPRVAQGSLADAIDLLQRRWVLIVSGLVAVTGAVALALPWFIPLIYGAEYRRAVWYAELYLLVPLLITIYSLFTKVVFPAHRRGAELVKLALCAAVLDIIGFALLIPWFGLLGAILTQIFTAVVVTIYAWRLAIKMLPEC